MYICPNGRVSLSKQKLTSEMGVVSNIKPKVVQKHAKTAALKSALQQLNQLKEPKKFMPWIITAVWHHKKYM